MSLQLTQAAAAGVQVIRALQKGNVRAGRQQAKPQVCSPSERERLWGVAQAADEAKRTPMETAASPADRWGLPLWTSGPQITFGACLHPLKLVKPSPTL